MDEAKFSRRRLGKSVAATALTAIAHPGSAAPVEDHGIPPVEQSSESDLMPSQMQEVEARVKETLRRYGGRLSEEQRTSIRRVLVENQRMLAAICDFPLNNADAPAMSLKLHVDNPAAPNLE